MLAVVLSRDDDGTAQSVVRAIGQAQTGVPVAHWGLNRLVDIAARQADLTEWSTAMRARYLPDADGGASTP